MPADDFHPELLEHGLDAVLLTRPDGTVLYANPAACALFGYSREEFETLGRGAVVEPSDPRLERALVERSETGRFRGPLTLRRKDGTRFCAALSSAVYTDSEGQQRTSMFIRDLTEHEQRESALQRANAQLTRALEEVRQLQGIVPICSYCKRVRADADFWQQVEAYVSARAPVQFSHGICPTCYDHHVVPQLQDLRETKE